MKNYAVLFMLLFAAVAHCESLLDSRLSLETNPVMVVAGECAERLNLEDRMAFLSAIGHLRRQVSLADGLSDEDRRLLLRNLVEGKTPRDVIVAGFTIYLVELRAARASGSLEKSEAERRVGEAHLVLARYLRDNQTSQPTALLVSPRPDAGIPRLRG
jgi:hypothetical protein